MPCEPRAERAAFDDAEVGDGLRRALHEWLLDQPWMADVAAEVRQVGVQRIEVLDVGPPLLGWVVLVVEHRTGTVDVIQQFVVIGDHVPDRVPDEGIIGQVPGRRQGFVAWSALADPVVAVDLCRRVAPEVPMTRARPAGVDRAAVRLTVDAHWLVEFFHRLEDGPNPDVDVATELGGLATSVVAPVGVWRRGGADLAMVRAMAAPVRTAEEEATRSLRAVLEADPPRLPRRREVAVFAALGGALGALHQASASRFGSRPADVDDLRRVAEVSAAAIPQSAFASFERSTRASLARLDGLELGRAIRVHGRMDLEAAIVGADGWLLRAVTGQPGGAMRRWSTPTSPLWDLAWLLADLGRVAALIAGGADDPEGNRLVESWVELASDAVVGAYASTPGVATLLPAGGAARDAVLTVCGALGAAARMRDAPAVVDLRRLGVAARAVGSLAARL